MKNTVWRLLAVALFAVSGLVAIFYNKDYWEAGSWFSFGIAVLFTGLKPVNHENQKVFRVLSYVFMGIGILLLIMRLAGVLPVPVRPIPVK